MIIELLLGAYATLLTVLLMIVYRRRDRESSGHIDVAALLKECTSAQEKAAVLSAAADIHAKRYPWYERALSVTGVVAFAAMTLAAAVQTVRASLDEVSAQRLQLEIARSTERIAEADRVVTALSRVLVERSAGAAQLRHDEESVLRFRLQRLAEKPSASAEELREMIALAFGLRDYARVIELVDSQPDLLDEASSPDLVTLCEYYYLVGSEARAKDLLRSSWATRRSLSVSVQRRLIVMGALLEPDMSGLVEELAAVMRISSASAKVILEREVAAFSASSQRLALMSATDAR